MSRFPMTLFIGLEPMVINSEEELNSVLSDSLQLFQNKFGFRLFGGNGLEIPLTLKVGEISYGKKDGSKLRITA